MWHILDQYEIKARVVPGLIVLVPGLALALLEASLQSITLTVGIASGICAVALVYVLAQITAALGRAFQDTLIRAWGNPPSTQVVRWRDSRLGEDEKRRIAYAVSGALGRTMPTSSEEAADPVKADEQIGSIFDAVRSFLHDAQPDGLWKHHLAEYGMARNLTGSSWLSALVGIGVAVFLGAKFYFHSSPSLLAMAGVFLAWAGIFVLGRYTFLRRFTESLAIRYAITAWRCFVQSSQRVRHAGGAT